MQTNIAIDHFEKTGAVIPFAQIDMVRSFLEGHHPVFIEELIEQLTGIIGEGYPDELRAILGELPETDQNAFWDHLNRHWYRKIQNALDRVAGTIRCNYTDPIMQIVALLPKDELASMAENLVSLTSFMRRVSMDRETVG